MTMHSALGVLADRVPLPDMLLRFGIAGRVERTRRRLAALDGALEETRFAAAMADHPIAAFTEAANAQHYELPPGFFALVLGPRGKYSCCLYESAGRSLAEAEERALAVTAEHAQLADGQEILELGCGWGSLSLWMAEHFPRARITALSNARPQRLFIERQAQTRGLGNLQVITDDINRFETRHRFDRIVSVEMFEHMANWSMLLARIATWLKPGGKLFLHVFSHRAAPYRFDHANADDWIARFFFTGGMMPSHGLIQRCAPSFELEADWRWSGAHYARTARDWLANMDARANEVRAIFDDVYGHEASLWMRRWRLFFLATAGLFGHRGGADWGVSHYRLRRAADQRSGSRILT